MLIIVHGEINKLVMPRVDKDKGFYIKKVKTFDDKRGSLYEALRFETESIPGNGQIYVYTVEPGARRGDHYHKKKEEWFFCVSGELELLLKINKKRIKKKISAKEPEIIYVAPGTIHTLVNRKKDVSVVVAYASEELNQKEPDTYKVAEI